MTIMGDMVPKLEEVRLQSFCYELCKISFLTFLNVELKNDNNTLIEFSGRCGVVPGNFSVTNG